MYYTGSNSFASLRQGLVGAWCPSLPNGGSGNTLPDVSGYGNHGSLQNMSPDDWVSSQYGRALDFDGVNDYVDLGFILGTRSQVTLSAWFQKTGSTRAYLLGTQSTVSLGFGFELYETIAYINYFGTNAGTDYAEFASNLTGINHWCMVFNGGGSTSADKVKVYVNGVSQTLTFAGSVPTTVTANTSFKLARRDWSVSHSQCQADDIRIYSRALSESEIRLLASRPGIGLRQDRDRNTFYQFPSGARRRRILTGMP